MENRQLLAAFAWIGGGSTTNWTDGTNWNGGDAPVAGSDLIFSSKAVSRTAVNDFTPGTSFNSIAINDSGYNLSGNMIDLGSSLNDYASGASTLSVPITMTTSLDVEVASGGTLTMSGILDDGPQAYGLAVNQITSDDGTLSLTAANSYDGGTTFGVGTLAISNSNALGMGTFHSVPLGSSGGVLDLSGGIAVANAMSLTGALTPPAGVINNISDTNTLSGPITFNGTNTLSVTSGQLTLAGQIDQSIASSGLTKLGSGLLELDAANSCSGYVTIVTGTVLAANSTALGTGGVVIDSGTELQLRGGITVANPITLSGTGVSSSGGLHSLSGTNTISGPMTLLATSSIGVDAGELVDSGNIGMLDSPETLTKVGGGILQLGGTCTFNGTTTVNAGILDVEGSLNAFLAGVALSGGTLAGAGTTGGMTSGTGGILAPGPIGGTGTLTMDGPLTFQAGMSLDLVINSATSFDKIAGGMPGTGVVLTDTLLNLTLGSSYMPQVGDSFMIISFPGTGAPLSGTFHDLPNNATFTVGPATFQITYSTFVIGPHRVTLTVTAVTPTFTWSGLDPNNSNWSSADNWVGDAVPSAGSNLVFPSEAARQTNTNDLTADTAFNSIQIAASGYDISGNRVDLAGGVSASYGSGTSTLELPIKLTANQNIDVASGGELDMTGVVSDTGDEYGLTKTSAGTLVLSGANTYSGTTTVSAGVVEAENSGALGSTAGGTVASGAALLLSGGINVPAPLSISGTGINNAGAVESVLGSNTLSGAITLGADSNVGVDAGMLTISGAIGGSNAVTKVGSGTLDLTATNTYTGSTTINAGILLDDGTIAGSVSLNGGTLGGSGTISGAGIATTAASIIDPGAPAGGTDILTYSNPAALSFTSSATFHVDLAGADPGTGYDKLVITDPSTVLDLGGATLDVSLDFLPTLYEEFQIISQTHSSPVSGQFNGLSQFATFDVGPVTFSVGYFNSGVTLTAVAITLPTYTWSGDGTDNLWSDGSNWVGGDAPTPYADLVFPDNAARQTNVNDLTDGTLFDSITFSGPGYNFTGNAIDLLNGITDTASGTTTFAVATALAADQTVTVNPGDMLVLSGAISGSHALSLAGGGTLELAGTTANTYSGTTSVANGTILLDKPEGVDAFAGDLVIGVGTDMNQEVQLLASNQFPSSSNVTVNDITTFDLNGFDQTIASLALRDGMVNVPAGSTLTVDSGIYAAISINGAQSLIQGPGALDLNGQSACAITVDDDPSLSVEFTISAVIQDGGIDKLAAGTLALSGSNLYAGATTVDAGVIDVQSNSALGTTEGASTVASGATVYFDSDVLNVAENFTIAGTGMNNAGALFVNAGTTTLTGSITMTTDSQIGAAAGASLTVNGVIGSGGTRNLTVANGSTGRTVLGAINSFTGNTTVTGGYLRAASSRAFGNPEVSKTVTVATGASLELAGGIVLPASKSLLLQGAGASTSDKLINVSDSNTIAGPVTLGANQFINVAADTTLTISGVVGETGGQRDLTTEGSGTLIVTTTETYTGTTQINGGTLLIDGNDTSSILVILMGGTIGGTGQTQSIFGFGGSISPGDYGPGILYPGSLSLASGVTVAMEINGPTPGTEFDQMNAIYGSYPYGATLDLSFGYTPAIGQQFTLVNDLGNQSVGGTFENFPDEGSTITVGPATYVLSYVGGDGNDIVLTTTDVSYTWSGLGSSSNWSDPANWVGDVVPTPGSRLFFPENAPRETNVDDLAPNFDVYSITFGGAGYDITGNAIDLEKGITATYDGGMSSFAPDITLNGTATIDVAAGGTLDVASAISASGAFGITKTGAGVLAMVGTSANSYYSGTTAVTAGTLQLDRTSGSNTVPGTLLIGDNIGTGAAVEISSPDQIINTCSVTVNQGSTLSLDPGVVEQFTNLTLQGATVDLSLGSALTPFNSVNSTFSSTHISSVIQGAGELAFQGFVPFTVAHDNSLSADLVVTAVIEDSPVGGLGGIIKFGTGTLALTAQNTYSGLTDVEQGVVLVEHSSALGVPNLFVVVAGSASVVFQGDGLVIPNRFISVQGTGDSGEGALWVAAGDTTLSGNIGLTGDTQIGANNGASLTLRGVTSGSAKVTVTNGATGVTNLEGSNTFHGNTSVTSGYLGASSNDAFGDPGTGSTVTVASGSSLQLSGFITVPETKSFVFDNLPAGSSSKLINLAGTNSLQGTVQMLDRFLPIDVATNTMLNLDGSVSGGQNIDKNGAGTLRLFTGNSYTGATNDYAGTLDVEGDSSSSSSFPVSSGATLRGLGSVSTVTADAGGTVAPGDVEVTGILQTGDVSFASGSTFAVRLRGPFVGKGYDRLAVGGTVTLAGSTLALSIPGPFVATNGGIFTLIENDGSDPVSGTFNGLPEGAIFQVKGQAFQISYVGGDGNDVVLTAVPIELSPASLPTPAAGSSYSEQLTPFGGSGTGYSFSATGLPEGLQISPSGLIYGTPTTANASPVEVDVTVTDSIGSTITQPYMLIVDPALGITPEIVFQPAVGSDYSQQLTGEGGSGMGYTFAAPDPPPGLEISPSGLISGIPASDSGSPYTVHVTVTDDQGASIEQNYVITVNPAIGSTPAILPHASLDGPYSQQITGTGGAGSGYAFKVKDLPPGMMLSETGLLSGTPTTATGSPFTIDVLVRDGQGATAILTYSFFVDRSTTATSLMTSASPISPTDSVTFTASVASTGFATDVPTGSIIFLDGDTVLQTVPLSGGVATLDLPSLSPGPHRIKAVYSGDSVYQPVDSNIVTQSVLITSTTDFSVTPPAPLYGQPLVFHLNVVAEAPYTPSGNVDFYDGDTLLGSSPLDETGRAFLTDATLSTGLHSFRAVYEGDDFYQGLNSQMVQVTITKNTSEAGAIQASAPQVFYGQTVDFTANFTSTSAGLSMSGTVAFYEGSTYLGTSSLVPFTGAAGPAIEKQAPPPELHVFGYATLQNLILSAGQHVITAVYSGDANYAGHTSETPVSIVVNPAQTRTTMNVASLPDGTTQVSATIVATTPGNPPLDGTVTFFDGNTPLGSVQVSGGIGSLNIGKISAGTHDFRAVYSSGGNSSASVVSLVFNGDGPQVTGLSRLGIHARPTSIVLTFNSSLDASTAEKAANYRITTAGKQKERVIRAVYDPGRLTVTLTPRHRLSLYRTYNLTVNGKSPAGVCGPSGLALDGTGQHQPGTDFTTKITWRALSAGSSAPAMTFANGQASEYSGKFWPHVHSVLKFLRTVATSVAGSGSSANSNHEPVVRHRGH